MYGMVREVHKLLLDLWAFRLVLLLLELLITL